MIMRPGQQLLLPAQPLFIWGTLTAALCMTMLLNMGLWGRAAWVPDVLALVTVFWIVHQPHRVGMGSAFLFGLLLDVHQGSMLGQHALAYTAMGFLAIALQRRLPWFTVPSQALQILPLFLLAHALELSVERPLRRRRNEDVERLLLQGLGQFEHGLAEEMIAHVAADHGIDVGQAGGHG